MKQLLVVLFIALVFSLVAASHSFSMQLHQDGVPAAEQESEPQVS